MIDVGNVDILGVRFRIVEQEAESWPTGQMGMCDHKAARITISDDLDPRVHRNTLFHEIMHAVFDLQGIDQNEGMVSQIATGLASIPQLTFSIGRPSEPRSG